MQYLLLRFLMGAAVMLSSVAYAKDVAIIANDADRQELVQLIDAALKAQGVVVLQQASDWVNKLKSAPEVVEHKEPSK